MGRQAVRNAIQSYLQGLGVSYLGTVYPARPTVLQEADYEQTMSGQAIAASQNGSACVAVVNIPSDRRQRQSDTGRGFVDDWNIHDIALELFFASTGGDAVAAQQDYDSVVDALIVGIRENPTPGGSSVVWSAGEFKAGVAHNQSEPYTSDDGLTILINGVIRFQAYEWISGQGV